LPPKKNHKLFFKRLKNIRISIQTPGVRPDPRAWPWPRAADTWRWVCPSLGDRDRSARLAAEPSERVCRLACLTTNTSEGAQARAPRCADPRVRAPYPGEEWRPVWVCFRITRLGSADPRAWLHPRERVCRPARLTADTCEEVCRPTCKGCIPRRWAQTRLQNCALEYTPAS